MAKSRSINKTVQEAADHFNTSVQQIVNTCIRANMVFISYPGEDVKKITLEPTDIGTLHNNWVIGTTDDCFERFVITPAGMEVLRVELLRYEQFYDESYEKFISGLSEGE
ncbi:hypothetical protein [Flammeovirga aprica]|uniref:Uncharacterized protein n=1 Tax=Flammeovirga aprica JL-4 TaxID=694437 RepID=A0A7X9P1D0_9BACT|nr:hypothetical protein [Flammeovirga aprica]NME67222.1 hypothetical protein [Flammeovirga aprica JL-4]